jgi:hypothetical protein
VVRLDLKLGQLVHIWSLIGNIFTRRNPFSDNSIHASNLVASDIYARRQIPLKRKNCPARFCGMEGDNETGVSSSKNERGANSRERGARRPKRANDYADPLVILIANDKAVGGVGAIRRD